MLKDEFNRLSQLFANAAEGKESNLENVFKESLQFFEHLKEQIATGSPEDKVQAIQMMTKMYQQMMAETKRITERSGMTEEQLTAFAENPANFSKEQWESLQASKEQIQHVGEDIVKVIEKGEVAPFAEGHRPPTDPKKPKEIQGKRSKWIRS